MIYLTDFSTASKTQHGYYLAKISHTLHKSENQITMSDEIKKLYRNPRDKRIAGVCSGIAEYLNVDVTVVRILFLIALLCFGTGLGIYLIVWLLAPEKA